VHFKILRRQIETTQATTASGPLWVMQFLNVLLANCVNVYAQPFVLEADILSTTML